MSSVSIVKGSITELETDALVNAANESLLAGSGVCGAIFKKAGHKRLQEACNKIGHCDTGSAVITPGFDLKSKYIIHAVGPRWLDGYHREPELLYNAYKKALALALDYHCRSIGFPLLSAGTFGYPIDLAWDQAVRACADFINEHTDESITIMFAVLTDEVMNIGKEKFRKMADSADYFSEDVCKRDNESRTWAGSRSSGDAANMNHSKGCPEINSGEDKAPDIIKKAHSTIVNIMDQNADGVFDVNDIAHMAGNISSSVLKMASDVRTGIKQNRDQLEAWADHNKNRNDLKELQPIFEDSLNGPDFSMEKLVRIIAPDKRHIESGVCKGSIGHKACYKDVPVLNIYPEYVDSFGLSFYPDLNSEVYYVDPCDRDHYIAVKDYFDYLKIARVNELQKIAQDLGAKHFRVTYKEETESSTDRKMTGKLKLKHSKVNGNAEVEHNQSGQSYSKLEISAEMDCLGHAATEPKLVYFQKDPIIRNLIQMRMSENNPIGQQSILIKCAALTGIKENDAVKIDAALSAMNCSMFATLTDEARHESKRAFEYEIVF